MWRNNKIYAERKVPIPSAHIIFFLTCRKHVQRRLDEISCAELFSVCNPDYCEIKFSPANYGWFLMKYEEIANAKYIWLYNCITQSNHSKKDLPLIWPSAYGDLTVCKYVSNLKFVWSSWHKGHPLIKLGAKMLCKFNSMNLYTLYVSFFCIY